MLLMALLKMTWFVLIVYVVVEISTFYICFYPRKHATSICIVATKLVKQGLVWSLFRIAWLQDMNSKDRRQC